ncbi:hypothetical protein NJL88_40700 [Streptomyces sp. DK15]|uniref:hypothetical protein n=1 Tax=Streptomyces sp. DK15 TaxID=2957499 RepID=UPI0029A60965|nr:hypothetical protein [Streptomyces sp. DK15]MDX2396286.1 hypothetical protein [Streptomyces sp. DK15]
MRKALSISAIVLASSMALGGTATAFAADTTSPAADAGPTAGPTRTGLKLSTSSAKPGDSISFEMRVPDGSTHLSVSSEALGDVRMTDGRGGTAKVADVKEGTYGVSLTGTGPDGAELRATARIVVKADAPKPTPAPSDLRLSQDSGRPGDRITVTVKTSEKDASVKSAAFTGGQVNLKGDGKGTFTGTATVAPDVKTGYYGVDAYAGGKKFDTVKFSTEAKATPDVKPVTPVKPTVKPVQPLRPSEHRTPKGSVNTGQAPAGTDTDPSRG